jgi:hypothetical protein
MKPLPAPTLPGKTEFERFDNAVRRVLSVSKEEMLKREQEEKQQPEAKRLRNPGRPARLHRRLIPSACFAKYIITEKSNPAKKRNLRVVKWLSATPAVAVCAFCSREFKAPMSTLAQSRDAQANLQQQFDQHQCYR